MKKICIVLTLFVMFLFIGCGSDEEEDTVPDTDTVTDTDPDYEDSLPDNNPSDNGDSAENNGNSDDTDSTDDSEIPDEGETDGDTASTDDDVISDDTDSTEDEDSTDDTDSHDDTDPETGDPCENVSCGNGGVCTAENGSVVCKCPDGFYDNGTTCTVIPSKPDWIGVQWPFTITASVGDTDFNTLTVFGRIYIEGVTGCPLSDHPQQNSWKAQLGYKKGTGSAEYPIVADSWKWIDASFNSAFTCEDSNQNHEYMASFPTDEAGNFIYIFRFSLDNGATWWYADKGIGPDVSDIPGPNFITSGTNYPGKATIN